jgi:hypothetical protein
LTDVVISTMLGLGYTTVVVRHGSMKVMVKLCVYVDFVDLGGLSCKVLVMDTVQTPTSDMVLDLHSNLPKEVAR